MLVFIVGPMGSGKTTLIHHLCKIGCGHPIPVFTTRPQRPGELEKISVSPLGFEKIQSLGLFYRVNHVLNHMYGSLQDTVIECCNERTRIGLLDLSIRELDEFRELSSLKVLILPENIEQLRTQLVNSERFDRLSGMEKDYQDHLVFSSSIENLSDWLIVPSTPNKLHITAQTVQTFIQKIIGEANDSQ
jgi:guanylate kinase